MGNLSPITTMGLIAPGVLSVFGIGFVWAWLLEKRRHYLLLFAAACTLFAIAGTLQALALPRQSSLNAIVTGALHTSAVLLAAEGMLRRYSKQLGSHFIVLFFTGIMGLLWYFAYISPNLLVRVYTQNFGYGFILLVASLRLAPLSKARYIDRALFWLLLTFAIQFIVRPILTIGLSAPADRLAFGSSLFWHALQVSLAILGSALAFTLLAATLTDVMEDLRRERDNDGLTGVLNKRGFEERGVALFRKLRAEPVALVVCDLDHFKGINDTLGHSAGDEVLSAFGKLLRETADPDDLIGRIGGDEFAVILPNKDMAAAIDFAERLRQRLEAAQFTMLRSARNVTASFGITRRRNGESLHAAVARADSQLYGAKAKGRNIIDAGADLESSVALPSECRAPRAVG